MGDNYQEDLEKAQWYLTRAFDMLDGSSDKRMDIVRGMIHYIRFKEEK